MVTACRSGEVRRARWEEVNLESGVWTIPADRAKTQRQHRVPLAPQAIAILDVQGPAMGVLRIEAPKASGVVDGVLIDSTTASVTDGPIRDS